MPRKFVSHDIGAARVFNIYGRPTRVKILFFLAFVNSFAFPFLSLFVIKLQVLFFSFSQFQGETELTEA